MKRLFLILVLCLFATTAFAETYLIINKQTKEVVSISPWDDAQVSDGNCEKVIIQTKFEDIQLEYAPEYYTWQNNRFVSNTKKLSDEANAQIQAEEKAAEEKEVQEYIRDEAIKAMKANGKEFKYLKEK